MTGDLYIGDVGQGTTEEVNVGPNAMAGLNFGWDIYEGTACHEQTVRDCATPPTSDPDVVFPVETVATGGGGGGDDRNRAIIGGYVYRGCKLPDYHGTYFYGTLNGVVRSLEWTAAGGATNVRDWPNLAVTSGGDRLSAFGQDRDGEVYVVAMDEGVVYKIVPVP
jgi:hypothetical protein